MFAYLWPVAIIVFSNIVYQICAKGIPEHMNTYASMTVTYTVSALFSLLMFFVTTKGSNFFHEVKFSNWATIVLGIVITGLEVGFIFAYKAGWKVSTLATVSNAFLAIGLIFLGFFVYREVLTFNKLFGVFVCLIGIWFINR